MPVISRIIEENEQYRIVEERDEQAGYRGERLEWKPGTAPANQEAIRSAAAAGKDAARDRIAALTRDSKGQDQAARIASLERMLAETNRAVLHLTRLVLGDFDSPPDEG